MSSKEKAGAAQGPGRPERLRRLPCLGGLPGSAIRFDRWRAIGAAAEAAEVERAEAAVDAAAACQRRARYSHLQMPRKLKTYQTSQGFYDLAVATPRKSKVQRILKAAKTDEKEARKATLVYERERERRERQRQKEETAAAKVRACRHAAVAKAEAALESARQEHEATATKIEKDLAEIEQRAKAEEARWNKVKERLQAALRKASE